MGRSTLDSGLRRKDGAWIPASAGKTGPALKMLPIPLAVISLGVLKVLPAGSIQDSRLDPKTGKS
jgi:hypothetical protein